MSIGSIITGLGHAIASWGFGGGDGDAPVVSAEPLCLELPSAVPLYTLRLPVAASLYSVELAAARPLYTITLPGACPCCT